MRHHNKSAGLTIRGDIDDIQTRPFPNEHAARLRDPGDFVRIRQLWSSAKGVRGLGGPLKSNPKGPAVEQTIRFDRTKFTADEAKKWLKDHDYKNYTFEAATGGRAEDLIEPRNKTERRNLTVRTFALRSDTLDEDERSIEAVLATEAPVLAFDLRRFEVVLEVLRMDGAELPANGQVVMLDSHDRSSVQKVLGSTRQVHVENVELIGRNVYADTDAGEDCWKLVRGGHVTDNSVGYVPLEFEIVERGKKMTIKGVTYEAPGTRALRVTTRWRLSENSNVPVGADALAKMRDELEINGKETQTQGGSAMNEELRKFLEEHGLRAEASEEEATTYLEGLSEEVRAKAPGAQTKPAPKKPAAPAQRAATDDDGVIKFEQVKAEAKRATKEGIEEARVEVEAERKELEVAIRADGAAHEMPAEVIDASVRGCSSIEEARGKFLEHMRTSRASVGFPNVQAGTPAAVREDIEAALLLRGSAEDVALEAFGEERVNRADKQMREISMADVCRLALQLDGHAIPGNRDEMIRIGFSTGSLSNILGNTAGKLMLKGFSDTPQTWREWCPTAPLSDFKDHKMVRMQTSGGLKIVGSGGEVEYSTRSEDVETISVDTYAENFGVTRQDIINDDVGVFTKIPKGQGIDAARRVSKLVYTVLLANAAMGDTVAIFHATHGNLNTTNSLTPDHLATAVAAFRNQTDASGEPIDMPPTILLVPSALEEVAKQLATSDLIQPYGGTSGTTRNPDKNVWKGLLKPVIEPRLQNASYSGYSTTSWYLMAGPTLADNVTVAFLNGRQTPTLERFDGGADRLGLVFRVYLDFGAKAAEYRGMSLNQA